MVALEAHGIEAQDSCKLTARLYGSRVESLIGVMLSSRITTTRDNPNRATRANLGLDRRVTRSPICDGPDKDWDGIVDGADEDSDGVGSAYDNCPLSSRRPATRVNPQLAEAGG
jgi:hypothetical protein